VAAKHTESMVGGVAIGIATRNAEDVLPSCLRSLLAQTVQPSEYIVCIGPSSDSTEELIREFVDQTTVPIKIIYDKAGIGTGYARKTIIENCSQEYVIWADSDFIFPPNWVEILIEILKRDKFDYLEYPTDENIITQDKATEMNRTAKLPDSIDLSSLKRKPTQPFSILVLRREAAIEVGNYDPYFVRGQGLDLTIRLNVHSYKGIGYRGMNVHHIWEGRTFRKSLSRATYFRFLYKYGLDYALLGGKHTEHSIAFFLRSCVVLSFPLLSLFLIMGLQATIPLLMLLGGYGVLIGGLITGRRFSLISCINQFVKCFGEYCLLYKILTDKNKPKRGYGKKFLKERQTW